MKKLTKLVIGSQTYTVGFDNTHLSPFGAVGVTHKDTQRIILADNLPNDAIADTLIHEVLHAICHNYIPDVDDSDEEKVVTQIAHGLTQVIRDNPQLMKEVAKLL